MSVQFMIVEPIEQTLVDAVAIAIWRSDPYHVVMRWEDCDDAFREKKRANARAALAVMFTFLIALEGADDADH
jgi:hypothetical protein